MAQAQLRALFVINSLAGGGAERVFSVLVRELNRSAPDLSISVVLLDRLVAEAYNLPDDVSVTRLNAKGSMLRSIARLRLLVRRTRPDVALSFLSRANVATVLSTRLSGTPAIISERVNTNAHLQSGRFGALSRILVRGAYPRAQRVLAVSQGVANTLQHSYRVQHDRICVIHNPVDLRGIRALALEEPPFEVSARDIVTMGRLVTNKNTAMAIRALAQAQTGGRLIVLGEGPLRDELAALASSAGVGSQVVFAGFVANPYSVLARAGTYLLSSNAEGFPNAMVEAMALSLPVIATDCPSGPSEILETSLDGARWSWGTGGALVPMNDHEAMGRCMRQLVKPEWRERVAREAASRASAFSLERAVESYRQAILGAVAPERGPPE